MNEIVQQAQTSLFFEQCEISPIGLKVYDTCKYEEWQKIGTTLRKIDGAIQFWIGDWINQGEDKYGQKYEQAMDMTDKDIYSLQNIASICRNIETSRRRELLSFSHHVEVAKLEPKLQTKWLKIAEEERLSTRELRQSIRSGRVVRTLEIQQTSGSNSGILNIEGIVREALIWKRTVFDADKVKWTPELFETLDRRVIAPLKDILQALEDKRKVI